MLRFVAAPIDFSQPDSFIRPLFFTLVLPFHYIKRIEISKSHSAGDWWGIPEWQQRPSVRGLGTRDSTQGPASLTVYNGYSRTQHGTYNREVRWGCLMPRCVAAPLNCCQAWFCFIPGGRNGQNVPPGFYYDFFPSMSMVILFYVPDKSTSHFPLSGNHITSSISTEIAIYCTESWKPSKAVPYFLFGEQLSKSTEDFQHWSLLPLSSLSAPDYGCVKERKQN